ncbi:MAG: hypothetical protein JO069_16030 [Verrucomicrobia bacterium]|nr:hypothetical protein [Verrucomicrobiota bacterium]
MILLRWNRILDPQRSRPGARCITAAVVFPPAVKRRLATLETAIQRALELGRDVIERTLPPTPDLSAFECVVEVTLDERQPLGRPHLETADGTRVWLMEAKY